jgi:uncharacterized protein (TIRG00374 family)
VALVRAGNALRTAAALALLVAALFYAGPAQVWEAARDADWRWIGAALLLVAADRVLMAQRWIALLRATLGGGMPPVSAIVRVFLVSSFLGTFLPGIGGDAVRTYALNRVAVPVADAFASVFVDRFLGIISTLLMAAAGVLLARDLLQDRAIVLGLAALTLICAAAAALVFSPLAGRLGLDVARRLHWARLERIVEGALTGLQQYARHHGLLALVLGGSVAVQILRVLQAWCLGRALGLPLPVETYFALVPVVLLVLLLPISINGIGTGQIAFVALFSRVGVSAADAFTLSVLYLALGAAGNLPGGVIYLFDPKVRRAA